MSRYLRNTRLYCTFWVTMNNHVAAQSDAVSNEQRRTRHLHIPAMLEGQRARHSADMDQLPWCQLLQSVVLKASH